MLPPTAPASCTTRSSAAASTTGSTTRRRARDRDRPRAAARACRGDRRAGVRRRRAAARRASSTSCPGVGETIAWARALLALGDGDARRHARRRAEGARGHRARARAGSARGCLRPTPVGRAVVSHRLTLFAASLRAGGVRVGVGELLAAHRALAAVDPALARGRLLRAARRRCARGTRTSSVFDAGLRARSFARRTAASPRTCSTTSPSDPPRCRASARRRPAAASSPRRPATSRRGPVPGRLERDRAAAREGLRATYTRPERAPPARCSRGSPRRGPHAPLAPHARRRAGAASATTCAGRCARRCATAASRSSAAGASPPAAAAAGAGRRRVGLDGALRAHAAPVPAGLRRGAQARRGVRLRHPADADHARARRPRPRPRAGARRRARSIDWSGGTRIGAALARAQPRPRAPHGPRRGGRRSCPTAGIAETPSCWRAEMARLRRTAHRLVWLNPLAADPGYEPLTRGMRAALPHTDRLLAGQLDRLAGRAGRPAGRRTLMKDVLDGPRRRGRRAATRSRWRRSSASSARRRGRPARRWPSTRAARSPARCPAAASRARSSRSPRRCWRARAPRLLHFGIADAEAWDVGLPCGGEIDVWVERYEP